MKTARAQMILGCLRKALQSHGADQTDGQLLGQFVAHRDESAFAALVRRHGPMVFGVCRRILRNAQDAEDAFQAAFLVLARKASRLRDREAVGSWLYGVAYRAALEARKSGLRRKTKEQQVEDMPHPLVMPQEDQSELLAALDRELSRLPGKYLLPVVLCELEGRSRKEAARQLGLPEGTLSSRLATARKTLAKRMAVHGPAVTGASLTALFASEVGAAVVPGPLVASTIKAASGVVSAGVVALAEGVLKAMLLTKIKAAALVLLLAASVGVGTATLTYGQVAAEAGDAAARQQLIRAGAAGQPGLPRLPAAAGPEKNDLEAMRLEIEALRVSLQATRERVEALEAVVQAQQKPVGKWTAPDVAVPVGAATPTLTPGGGLVPAAIGVSAPSATPPQPEPTVPEGIPNFGFNKAPPGGIPETPGAHDEAELVNEVAHAAKMLARDPKNKEASDALDRAVKQLKSLAAPKPATAPQNDLRP